MSVHEMRPPIPAIVDGPLLRPTTDTATSAPEFDAPDEMRCPDCRKRLRVTGVQVFGGVYCVARWRLGCADGHAFEYDTGDNFTEAAYADDPVGRERARADHAARLAEIERRRP